MTSSQKPRRLQETQEPEEPKAPVAAAARPAGAVTATAGQPLLRVEKGHAEADELAALLVALLALARPVGSGPIETVPLPATVRWNAVRTFVAPHSWQTVA
ncbi:acyl-CoA carboxylase epsilon subunit [Streptomyces atratus]|uniref:acyl-CoA carboxylase epsilon subunit n=1 Tax=Streptomyces atratus TaxID=1893 RepID=UPI002250A0DE|nr:acyl-CoA carboxylase epsilon subunit [Streptomyces atratus]MCX5339139.1 acyl-CoA carboxylase epsilon subunit [Streptomyces atratus]